MEDTLSRRSFLAGLALTGATAAAAGLAGCAPASTAMSETGGDEAVEAESVGLADIDPGDIARQVDCDILVCGAGAAGLTAAAYAAEQGAKVVCIEKTGAPCDGGANHGFINTKLGLANGGAPIDVNEAADFLFRMNDGLGDTKIHRAYVEYAPIVGDWLVEMGDKTGHTVEIFEGPGETHDWLANMKWDNITEMVKDYAESQGAEFLFRTPVVQVVRDGDGRVTGAIAEDRETGEYVQYNAAKGVLLATGGIMGNPDMIREYVPAFDPDTLFDPSPNSPEGGEDGDAIPICRQIGARIGDKPFAAEVHFLKGAMPTEGVLFVDGSGDRMPDNALMLREDYRANIMSRRPGKCTWRIVDSKEGYPEPVPSSPVQPDYKDLGDPYDSWEDMAEANGFDSAILQATVENWNKYVSAGSDPQYGADLSTAMALDTPPYYAQHCPGVSFAFIGGPVINEQMRVVDEDYRPIEGLYAAGCSTSGCLGVYYNFEWGGFGRTWSEVSGYLAVKDMLERA